MNSRKAAEVGAWQSLKYLRSMADDCIGVHEELFSRFGDRVTLRFMGERIHFFYHPNAVKHVLKTNPKNYEKGTGFLAMELVIGKGLVTADGEFWHKSRKAHAPEFHTKKIDGIYDGVVRNLDLLLERWRKNSEKGTFDSVPETSEYILGVIGQGLFGVDLDHFVSVFREVERSVTDYVSRRMYGLVNFPTWLPSPANLRFRRNMLKIDQVLYTILGQPDPNPGCPLNVVTRLRSTQQDGKPMFTQMELRNHIATLVLAASETTTWAISWSLAMIAKHPEVQLRIREELNAKVAGDIPTLEELKTLEYTEWAILETLRLRPPVTNIDRLAVADDEIDGVPIQAGDHVECMAWVTHRHPEFWSDPLRFDPSRFETSQRENRHPFSYFPFSHGPRACLGEQLAMMETKGAIAALFKNFQVDLDPDREIRPLLRVTMRPDPGVFVKATPLS